MSKNLSRQEVIEGIARECGSIRFSEVSLVAAEILSVRDDLAREYDSRNWNESKFLEDLRGEIKNWNEELGRWTYSNEDTFLNGKSKPEFWGNTQD